ncbi:MAG: Cof-type HAD-IIB family hydrolase [Lactobacillus sp.]
MNKKIKLIAIDIDGTLANSKNELTDGVKAAVQKASRTGIRIVLCSGRPFSGVRPWLARLGLLNKHNEYVICFNGAEVATTANEVLWQARLSYADYLQLGKTARQLGLHFHATCQDQMYTSDRDIGYWTIFETLLEHSRLSYRTPAEMRDKVILKGMFVDDPAVLDRAVAQKEVWAALSEHMTFSRTYKSYWEAVAKGATKEHGLAILGRKLGIDRSEMVGIGDQENDLTMINYAGTGVAMGNGVPVLKQAADFVTFDNDHDGVAHVIDLVLNHQL